MALAPSAHDAGSRASAPGPPGVLLASSNLDPELRRNTALSLSRDGGATWPHQLVLCEGSSGYSCAAELPDGRIGVLYEREGYSEIQGTSSPSTHGCGCPREWRRPG